MESELIVDKYAKLYAIAKNEMGVAEVPGTLHNKRILEYHDAVSLKAKTDEVPWCASFLNWCLREMNVSGTNSALARSFAKWGQPLAKPKKGAVIVFSRVGGGHVAIFDHEDKNFYYVLGGNQGNRVCIAAYKKDRVVSIRGFFEA